MTSESKELVFSMIFQKYSTIISFVWISSSLLPFGPAICVYFLSLWAKGWSLLCVLLIAPIVFFNYIDFCYVFFLICGSNFFKILLIFKSKELAFSMIFQNSSTIFSFVWISSSLLSFSPAKCVYFLFLWAKWRSM